ncbi:Receptor-like protein kinase HERK 1 [Bienertia sinuspersici]
MATNNFDESLAIGTGGFGKVYRGFLADGTKVAVKLGHIQSQQGQTLFQTEIEMLSQFRNRHLVSLIGYCDENSENTLIFQYMENGTLKSHPYGSGYPYENFKAKVADFGLSKPRVDDKDSVTSYLKGSFGYIDPEYIRTQKITNRPSMHTVLSNLEYALKLLEAPEEQSVNVVHDIYEQASTSAHYGTTSEEDLSSGSMSKVFSEILTSERR